MPPKKKGAKKGAKGIILYFQSKFSIRSIS